MIRNCPKCSYIRKASDSAVPDWQCPGCGIAYAKFLEQNQAPASPRAPALSAPAAAFQKDVMGLSGFPTIVIGNRVTQGFDEGQILASLKEL